MTLRTAGLVRIRSSNGIKSNIFYRGIKLTFADGNNNNNKKANSCSSAYYIGHVRLKLTLTPKLYYHTRLIHFIVHYFKPVTMNIWGTSSTAHFFFTLNSRMHITATKERKKKRAWGMATAEQNKSRLAVLSCR